MAPSETGCRRSRMTVSQAWPSRIVLVVLATAGAAYAAWLWSRSPSLPPGFASGNGRIEAVDVDISTKLPGRVEDILVK